MIVSFRSGMPRQQQKVWAKNVVYYNRVSQGVLPLAPVMQPLTDTIDNMHMPVNAVLEGHQRPIGRAVGLQGITGPMAAIFNEK